MRYRGTTRIASGLVLGSASLTVAASTIHQPAQVADRAHRLTPTFEPELTPEQRAIAEMTDLVNTSSDHRSNLLGDVSEIGIGVVATPDGVPYGSLLVVRAPSVPRQT